MMQQRCFLLAVLALGLTLTAVPIGAEQAPAGPDFVARAERPSQEVQARLDELFYDWESFRLDLAAVAHQAHTGRLRLHLGSRSFDLVLEPHDLRAPGFREVWMTGSGEVEQPPSQVATFAGHLAGVPESDVRLLILPNLLQGYLRQGEEWLFLDPLSKYGAPAEDSRVLLFSEGDVRPDAATLCGTGALHSFAEQLLDHDAGELRSAAGASTTVKQADVATEADYEYFLRYGSNTNSQITGILNQVDGIFESQHGLSLRIVFQSVWASSSDPYSSTDPNTLLDQFRNHWNANRGDVIRDLAHLFTGKDLNGGVIGIAWVGVVCNNPSYAYGVSQDFSLMVKLVAHEIGHNFAALHDDQVSPPGAVCDGTGPIMCSFIQSAGPETFSSRSRTDVGNHVGANGSCLDTVVILGPFGVTANTPGFVNVKARYDLLGSATDPATNWLWERSDNGGQSYSTWSNTQNSAFVAFAGTYDIYWRLSARRNADGATDTDTDITQVCIPQSPQCLAFLRDGGEREAAADRSRAAGRVGAPRLTVRHVKNEGERHFGSGLWVGLPGKGAEELVRLYSFAGNHDPASGSGWPNLLDQGEGSWLLPATVHRSALRLTATSRRWVPGARLFTISVRSLGPGGLPPLSLAVAADPDLEDPGDDRSGFDEELALAWVGDEVSGYLGYLTLAEAEKVGVVQMHLRHGEIPSSAEEAIALLRQRRRLAADGPGDVGLVLTLPGSASEGRLEAHFAVLEAPSLARLRALAARLRETPGKRASELLAESP